MPTRHTMALSHRSLQIYNRSVSAMQDGQILSIVQDLNRIHYVLCLSGRASRYLQELAPTTPSNGSALEEKYTTLPCRPKNMTAQSMYTSDDYMDVYFLDRHRVVYEERSSPAKTDFGSAANRRALHEARYPIGRSLGLNRSTFFR